MSDDDKDPIAALGMLTGYDLGPAFELTHKLRPLVAGRDLREVATAFAMILGDAQASDPGNVAGLQVYVSNIIGYWCDKRSR